MFVRVHHSPCKHIAHWVGAAVFFPFSPFIVTAAIVHFPSRSFIMFLFFVGVYVPVLFLTLTGTGTNTAQYQCLRICFAITLKTISTLKHIYLNDVHHSLFLKCIRHCPKKSIYLFFATDTCTLHTYIFCHLILFLFAPTLKTILCVNKLKTKQKHKDSIYTECKRMKKNTDEYTSNLCVDISASADRI